ncbi:hypothetical protein FRB99_003516 [Tulasnella sp. 403]|nr:hypothetical protein FRB99_003516 [Tulasnella sp. 403]
MTPKAISPKSEQTLHPDQGPVAGPRPPAPKPQIPPRKAPSLKSSKAAITLTPAAVTRLQALLTGPTPQLIRIGVRNKGCAGMSYHLEYVEKPGKFDEVVEQDGVKVLIDSKALFSIIGSEMDWKEDRLREPPAGAPPPTTTSLPGPTHTATPQPVTTVNPSSLRYTQGTAVNESLPVGRATGSANLTPRTSIPVRSSFASIAAAATPTSIAHMGSRMGDGASTSGPSSTPLTLRRPSVPNSPSPRIHRAGAQWGASIIMAPSTSTTSHDSPSRPGGSSSAPPGALGTPSFPRPPYLEHTAFSYLFKEDLFSRPPLASSLSSPSKTSSRGAESSMGPNRSATGRRGPASLGYMPMQVHMHSNPSSPSPGNSDGEEGIDYAMHSHHHSHTNYRKIAVRPEEESFVLPTRWNEGDRHASIQISADGRELTFLGSQGSVDKEEAASARTNHPIPSICGVYYYEVRILNKGNKGHIGVGFAMKHCKLSKLPGWENESWGYHGDDGKVFSSQGERTFGPKFSTEDVVGCGIDFSIQRIFFTKNGTFLDHVFQPLPYGVELYPFVGLRSSRESVQANFGQIPFRFDIETHVRKTRNQAWKEIQRTLVEWRMDSNGMNLKASTEHPAGSTNGITSGNATNGPPATSRLAALSFSLPSHGSASTDNFPVTHDGSLGPSYSTIPSQTVVTEGTAPPPTTHPPPSATHDTVIAGKEGLGGDLHSPMRELVLEYLVQSGYPRAAKAFKAQCDDERRADDQAKMGVDEADAKRLGSNWVSKRTDSGGMSRSKMAQQDGDVDMDDALSSSFISSRAGPTVTDSPDHAMDVQDAAIRRRIMDAIRRGDIDAALGDLDTHYPTVAKDGDTPETRAGGLDAKALNGDGERAGIRFKLRCRKLVEMVLDAAATEGSRSLNGGAASNGVARGITSDAMDLDSESATTAVVSRSLPMPTLTYKQQQKQKAPSNATSVSSYEAATRLALAYGQSLHADYGYDKRPKVQALLKRTSSLVAYTNPLDVAEVGEEVVNFAGPGRREALADEVNEVILESQGRKSDSVLERLYRQASGVVRQLAVMGDGQAAFADVRKEILGER